MPMAFQRKQEAISGFSTGKSNSRDTSLWKKKTFSAYFPGLLQTIKVGKSACFSRIIFIIFAMFVVESLRSRMVSKQVEKFCLLATK
jgi:hypothetical protein